MSDWYMAQLARQDGYGDEPPPPVQPAYDPWERAAAAVRFGAKPLGGRQEGAATTLPQEILAAPVRAAAGFTKAAFDRAAEEHGGVPQQSTDYDPRRMGALLGAETALNTTGFGTPFSQAGALGSAGGKAVIGELASQAPPFYSAVERAVQGAKQNVAPGQQWAGYLRNQPGVKPEEIEALKLGQLFEQPGALPKQAVLDQIAANRVNVGEVVKSERSQAAPATRVNEIDQQLHDIQNEFDRLHQFNNSPASERRAALAAQERELRTERAGIVANWQDQSSGRTKFQQYTLPGGENYREMLLTLPTKDAAKSTRMTELEQKLRNAGDYDTAELNSLRQEYKRLADETRADPTFKSSHFDEPNILAHVRYNDRVIDGKKTLFVEEVQSDWHQAGKKKGYQQEIDTSQLTNPTRSTGQYERKDEWRFDLPDGGHRYGYGATEEAARADVARLERVSSQRVPDAPFKTTWPELAMKRVIREAAEKGYDKVAWTPGSVQAARYDLSKHVKEIEYIKRGDKYELGVTDIRGSGVDMPNKAMTLEEIEETLGKEMAEKISKGEGKKYRGHEGYTLDGLDLQVGGEGMKGFYDEILPATVNKLVKKHGGRVTQGEIVKPEMKLSYEELQRRRSGEKPDPSQFKQPVHTIDITPSLREQAMKGFPLFTAGGVAVMGGLAAQDQYRR